MSGMDSLSNLNKKRIGNVEAFCDYLLLVTSKITSEDERIQKLVEDEFIIP